MYKILAKTFFVGKKLIFLPTCHSTNLAAAEYLKAGEASEGTLVITDHQYNGQGQRGNAWVSEPGANLTFTVVFQPDFLHITEQFFLNIVVSLGVADYLASYGGHEVKVKWPNDVYIGEKKVCGILIKNYLKGETIEHAIVGIGVNINQRSFSLPHATSLALATGRHYELPDVLTNLSVCLERRYIQLRSGKRDSLKAQYESIMYWYGEPRQFESNEPFEGVIEGVDELGRLKVRTVSGVRVFNFKEVAFIE